MNTDRAAVLTKACGWTAVTTAILVLTLVTVLAGPFFLTFVVGSVLPTLGFGVAAVRLGSRLAEHDNAARWAAGVLLGVAFPFFLVLAMRVPGSLDQPPGAGVLAAVVFGFLAATSLSVPLLLLSTSSRQDFGDEPFTDEALVRPLGIMIVLLLFLAKSALVQANADYNPRAGPTPRNTECEPGRLYLGQPGPGANVVKPAPPRRLASEPRARMIVSGGCPSAVKSLRPWWYPARPSISKSAKTRR